MKYITRKIFSFWGTDKTVGFNVSPILFPSPGLVMKTVRLIREKAIIRQCNLAAEFTTQACVLNKQLPLPAALSAEALPLSCWGWKVRAAAIVVQAFTGVSLWSLQQGELPFWQPSMWQQARREGGGWGQQLSGGSQVLESPMTQLWCRADILCLPASCLGQEREDCPLTRYSLKLSSNKIWCQYILFFLFRLRPWVICNKWI